MFRDSSSLETSRVARSRLPSIHPRCWSRCSSNTAPVRPDVGRQWRRVSVRPEMSRQPLRDVVRQRRLILHRLPQGIR